MISRASERLPDAGIQNLPNPARWETSRNKPLGELDVTTPYMKPILQDLGVADEHVIDDSFTRISNFFKPHPDAYYISEYSSQASTIVVASIERVPERYRVNTGSYVDGFAHITFPMWKSVCREDRQCISRLGLLLSKNIVDPHTVQLVQELFPRPMGDAIYCWQLTPDDYEFYTMLRSPIGYDMAQVPMLYTTSLNFKIVTSIRIYYVTRLDSYFMAEQLGQDENLMECE